MISRKEDNVIEIEFKEYCKIKAPPLFQYDKGQILRLLDIPDESVVEFSNKLNEKSKPYIVQNSRVAIPDFLLEENAEITVFVKFVDEKSETTVKVITIPIITKPESDVGVSPENQVTFIEQMQDIMNTTKDIAKSVRDDADSGKFNGKPGEVGYIAFKVTKGRLKMFTTTATNVMFRREGSRLKYSIDVKEGDNE